MARAKTGIGSVMSEKDALQILKNAGFKSAEPFHAKMTPWLMECLKCHNVFKRRLRDVINGFGCKYCNQRSWTPGMAEKRMREAGLIPDEAYKNAETKWKVTCAKCGKKSAIAFRHISSGSIKGCAHCALDKKQDFENKEEIIFQKIEALDYTIVPGEKYQGKRKPIAVICNLCGSKNKFNVGYLVAKDIKRGCKTCANNQLSLNAEICEMRFKYANLRPLDKVTKASQKVNYECLICGHLGACTANSLHTGRGCFKCGKARGGEKARVPVKQVIAEFAKYDLRVVGDYKSIASPLECLCLKCNRKVKKSYATLVKGKNGCQYCSEDKVDPEDAIISIRKRGFEPLVPFPGPKQPWRCICAVCKRESSPTHVGKSQTGSGCAFCSKNRVDPDEAIAFMLGEEIEPLESYPGSAKKWRCRCMKCSREIITMYNTVKNGSGCKYCAIQGMDFNSPAFIYLIIHPDFDALKIGIGSQELRIRQHTSLGWVVVKRWNYKTGYKASEIEEKVLEHLRIELGLNHYLTKEQMPQKGHTETFGLDDIDVIVVQKMIDSYSRQSIKPKVI